MASQLPPVLVSSCLLGTQCRFDGSAAYFPSMPRLLSSCIPISVCPEVLAGQQVPRDPVEQVGNRAMTIKGVDETDYFRAGAEHTLRIARQFGVRHALLKSGSPSCGCDFVYDGTFSDHLVRGMGFTAQLLSDNGIRVFSENDLNGLLVALGKSSTPGGKCEDSCAVATIWKRSEVIEEMEAFISRDELERLSDSELVILQRNVMFGEQLNRKLCRSKYYPLPRDLSFLAEKPLFQKWAYGKHNLVEIGVFEGASAIIFRSVMSSDGILHLIDPFIKIPDSSLTARPWMARLNMLRSNNGDIRWHRDYSYNIVKNWKESIDFLFIDGGHAESAVWNDWLSWHSFVDAGGVVLFHDARFGKGDGTSWDGWPGPTKVVDKLFRSLNKLPDWEIVDEIGSLVVVKRI